jgi:hypothetical protein
MFHVFIILTLISEKTLLMLIYLLKAWRFLNIKMIVRFSCCKHFIYINSQIIYFFFYLLRILFFIFILVVAFFFIVFISIHLIFIFRLSRIRVLIKIYFLIVIPPVWTWYNLRNYLELILILKFKTL